MPQDSVDPPAPGLTRLTGLEIKNFKSVRQADITIGALTVIIGANSTGKSSVLQAVLAMAQITRHRIDGHRIPLNGAFAKLGTFEAVRHQRADPEEPVRIGLQFSIDTKDNWWYLNSNYYLSEYPPGSKPSLCDVYWAIEFDSATGDRPGFAQISALEICAKDDEFVASVHLTRDSTSSLPSRQNDDSVAFTGSVRSPGSKITVSNAHISSGQVGTLFGKPPSAEQRVDDWFSAVADWPQPERSAEAGNQKITPQQAIQQAVWAIRLEEQAEHDFVKWYGQRADDEERKDVRNKVLEGFKQVLLMQQQQWGGTSDAESLDGFGPTYLNNMQHACAQYLASQVRYLGPLRHAPYHPFPSAPNPDLDEVGVEGEYVASVLQAHGGIERDYPVPGGPTEKLSLRDAVNRWMVDFGLAENLKVREDTPLVLGIDVKPPGLKREVALSAVGVGVSQVLPVVVQCLVAGPGTLVILEQPELHLHPAAQQCLADFLLACMRWGQKLLVETHSEYLVLRLRRRIAEDETNRLKDDLVLLFASCDEGETKYKPIELTDTGALGDWSGGFFDQGPDDAHQLLIAAAKKQRGAGGGSGVGDAVS